MPKIEIAVNRLPVSLIKSSSLVVLVKDADNKEFENFNGFLLNNNENIEVISGAPAIKYEVFDKLNKFGKKDKILICTKDLEVTAITEQVKREIENFYNAKEKLPSKDEYTKMSFGEKQDLLNNFNISKKGFQYLIREHLV